MTTSTYQSTAQALRLFDSYQSRHGTAYLLRYEELILDSHHVLKLKELFEFVGIDDSHRTIVQV